MAGARGHTAQRESQFHNDDDGKRTAAGILFRRLRLGGGSVDCLHDRSRVLDDHKTGETGFFRVVISRKWHSVTI